MDGDGSQDGLDGDLGQTEKEKKFSDNDNSTIKTWTPARYLLGKPREVQSENPYAVIILNQTIENEGLLVRVCSGAFYKVCADGGANRLENVGLKGEAESLCRPDVICGDLDSLRPEVEEHYQGQGTRIIKDPDQYSTDFTKCLKYISGRDYRTQDDSLSGRRSLDIAVIGGLGGRADQAFSQLHHLYAASQDSALASGDIYLITAESIIFLLHKGRNRIHTPLGPELLAENVGIIPIARPSVITTRGLEWDVDDWPTEFGTQISTSNHIRGDIVEVETTERVFFTVELAQKPK